MARESERRGEWGTRTRQSEHIERSETQRKGGGRYDAGPGDEGLPGAKDMDRPPSDCGTFGRTGEYRGDIKRGIRTIQDQER
jgi:hypothetical protein